MGAFWSVVRDEEGGSPETGLGDLPELCAAAVLKNLDPTEICQLAKLNRVFRGAASADFVWQAKLPENYSYLMGFVLDDKGRKGRQFRMKDIYARLCRPVCLDDGNKEFWLEKRTGGACMAIASKALVITGIDDRRYWSYLPTGESRDSSMLHTFNRSGGLRWLEKSTSASRLAHTVSTLGSIWAVQLSGLDVGYAPLTTYMGGTSSRLDSSFPHQMDNKLLPSAT